MHKPWTPEQLRAAHDKLTGVVRRGIALYVYTGQRGSDIVRLGFADIDEGGFSVRQRKTGRDVWCPIVPELAAEIANWEKRPGPLLFQTKGKPYSRKLFWKHFDEARANIPELADVTLHGLRCTARSSDCEGGTLSRTNRRHRRHEPRHYRALLPFHRPQDQGTGRTCAAYEQRRYCKTSAQTVKQREIIQ
jgi:integrase